MYLEATKQEIMEDKGHDLKTLLRRKGFLQYVTRTYPSMVPYMQGFHNTIDAWRPNRDSDTRWYIQKEGPKRK